MTYFFATSLSLLKPLTTGTNLSTINLATSDFKLSASTLLVNFYVSTLVEFFKSAFAA